MELPVGAKEEKRAVATENVINLMTKAHAIRCPGKHFIRCHSVHFQFITFVF